eukprot:m.232533 g.232533  ORF g.232533 m.232533 type:complete len:64 (+) comp15230_c0_seq1:2567-2758(+)
MFMFACHPAPITLRDVFSMSLCTSLSTLDTIHIAYFVIVAHANALPHTTLQQAAAPCSCALFF